MDVFLSLLLLFVLALALGVWSARKAKSLVASDPAFGTFTSSELLREKQTAVRSIAIYVLLAAVGFAAALLSGLALLGASVRPLS
jgi:hypothetical protein